MRPNTSAAVYRPDLGQVVMEYVEDVSMQPIGLQVMPLYPTALRAASFPVIPSEALLKLPETARAPRGHYNRGDWEYERGQFSTDEFGWEEPIDDAERSLLESEAPGIADEVATRRAWNHIMRAQEKRIADAVFNATTFTTVTGDVTNEWDDADNATPIEDVNDARETIRSACGLLPNALIIGWKTFQNLKNCDQIVDRLKYTFPGIDLNRMNSEQLAAVFNIPRVLIGGAVYDSSGKGIATSVSNVWDPEYAMLTRVATGRDLTEPCIGRTFLWTEDSPQNPIVESYREDQTRSDIIRVRHHVDECLIQSKNTSGAVVSNIAVSCSYLLSNIYTTA